MLAVLLLFFFMLILYIQQILCMPQLDNQLENVNETL